jgi:hypothetical protein
MIALWFAALFGLGSLAIRPVLIKSLLRTSGMEDAISAAALSVGMTNRVLIAVALTIVGGLLGLIASRLFPGAATRRRDSQAKEQVRRPFSASELAEEPLGDFAVGPLELISDDAALTHSDLPAVEPPPVIDIQSLQLARLPEASLPAPAPEPAEVVIDVSVESNSISPAKLGKAAQRLLAAELATLTPIELVERLGISMQLQRAGTEPTPRAKPAVPITRLQPAPPARADNEQVLRSALAALQRLSGAV